MGDFCDKPAPIRPGEELDTARLEPFLRRLFPGEAKFFGVWQFPSGHSNLTYSIQLGEKQLVLRRPPFGSKVKSAHDMGREYRVLSKLHAAYPPAPRVLAYCEDLSILGAPFYLMEPIHGIILRKDPPQGLAFPPDTARKVCETLIENLARLHALDFEAIGLAGLGRPQGYLERQVRGWLERYEGSKTHKFPEVEWLSIWMQQNLPTPNGAALVHNDYKLDNIIFDPGDFSGINGVLDWEMCTIGDPLSDLGTTLAYWVDAGDPEELQKLRWGPTTYPGSLTRNQLIQRYAQLTGQELSSMPFYLVLARFKLAVIVQQIYYRYHQGLTKDQRFASMPEMIGILLRAACHTAVSGTI
jgi:aminoglycoside phosphotransferase (APT) family kinase protein